MNDIEAALSAALSKTGFPFEHHVFQQMQRRGWVARTNRLYIDSEEDKTREMDLLCYRQSKGPEVTVCTAILISCKARNGKPWVLLTRDWPARRPSWYPYPPVPVWTNSEALNFEVTQPAWGLEYFNLADATGLKSWASDSPREVFALQEFEFKQPASNKAGTAYPVFGPKGDSSLYEGTMSLLKALAYENSAVKSRRAGSEEQIVYQFNLVQLIDGELYEARFGNAEPQVAPIDRYRYFARTMLNGEEFSARIEFCTRQGLPQLLDDLNKVHDFNGLHFNGRVHNFYEQVPTSRVRLDAFRAELETQVTSWLHYCEPSQPPLTKGWLTAGPCIEGGPLKIRLNIDEQLVARLNQHRNFKSYVRSSVKDIYRFEGEIEIEWDDDIPF